LIFQLCDYNNFTSNQIIGVYSMGLSTIYRHANHEFHKVWLRLVDPNDNNPTACVGYLRVSAFIVGPGERPPIHTQNEGGDDSDACEEEDVKSEQLEERDIMR
jgi:hypothetical protein